MSWDVSLLCFLNLLHQEVCNKLGNQGFPGVPESWCGREDSNFHDIAITATSTLRVYQFRHDRTVEVEPGNSKSFVQAQERVSIF